MSIRQHERERIAKLCDQLASLTYQSFRADSYAHIAALLRGKPSQFAIESAELDYQDAVNIHNRGEGAT